MVDSPPKYPGVFHLPWIKGPNKHRAQIVRGKVKLSLGTYPSPEEAAYAFRAAYDCLHPGKVEDFHHYPAISPARRGVIGYQVREKLGVPHPADHRYFGLEPGYTLQNLKQAYRAILLHTKSHPDMGGSPEQFRVIQQAYEHAKLTP